MDQSDAISLLRTVLYGWAVSLWQFLASMLGRLRGTARDESEHRPTSPTDCTPIDEPAFVRPDPLVYSQSYLRGQGLDVTYDNPDIVLFRGGVPVSSGALQPGTTYDVRVRVWNNSLVAPAIALPVHLSYRSFGVATQDHPIATDLLDVGVKGSADQPAFLTIPWTTPVTPGHYCLQVRLDPADDVEPGNNLGWENTNVVAAQSPATFTFALRNDTRSARTYRFELGGYELLPAPECRPEGFERSRLLDLHRVGNHPVPADFEVHLTPPDPTLAPDQEVTITVVVTPPAGFHGRKAINVNAFHDRGLAGGVTLTVVKEP